MDFSKEEVTVKYRVKQAECKCCGREFDESEFGEEREFDLCVKGFFEWSDFSDDDLKYFPLGDLPTMVRAWAYNTIHFYALSLEDILKIEESELKKITELIKKEIERLKSK